MASTESSMMESIVQSGSSSHTPNRKLRSMVWPNSVWRTSGWNCVANRRRSGYSMDATGHTSVRDVTEKPSGTRLTASRWLIHTVCSPGVPSNSADSPARVMTAGPYSPFSVCPTSPPSATAMACCP